MEYKMNNKNALIAGAFMLFVAIASAQIIIHFATMTTVSGVTIQDKERVVTGSGENVKSKYLIFTDVETFENVDSLLALKFNSSDVYGYVARGAKCNLTVTGFRVPLFSMYRNILDAECGAG
jgi:hypothetical protein